MLLLALSSVALADNREDAGKEFAAAQQAEKQKDFASAIEHYLKSNELAPHPSTAYNIALNYEKLLNFRQAAVYYQKYLDGSSDPPDRVKVQQLIADLQNKPSRITIRSSPAGAQITIDGTPAGVDPLVTTVTGGVHRIAAIANGMQQTQDIDAKFGEPQDLMLSFGPQAGILTILSSMPGTQLWIDGQPIALAPTSVNLLPGQHQVTAQAVGYAVQNKTVTIEAARSAQITFTLVRGGAPPVGNSGSVVYPPTPSLTFIAGLLAGSYFPVSDYTAPALEPQFGFRWGTGELYARFAFVASDAVKFGNFGMGYRVGAMTHNRTHVYYAANVGFSPGLNFDGRIGMALRGALGNKLDIYVEAGLGYAFRGDEDTSADPPLPNSPPAGGTELYFPVMAGVVFHK
ncbi:MAG: PEGA domain-containing protein [Kofleriaceae bacterium]|nr:PEGA domain-containing protein [Kofleriaceae bacterium]